MIWCEKIAEKVEGAQLINDSKTPSGRAHVGALRGVLIHDAVFRAIQAKEVPVRYTFGVDDYDPLDELPAGQEDFFRPYLGTPLCNVPPPPGSSFSDISEHYIQDFFSVFQDLHVSAETYRLRDIYRSGRFNEVIEDILKNADVVRTIYKEISGATRPDKWYPFQVVCEECGRIGTTEVTNYEGGKVLYSCRSDLVTWATGCGYQGKVSPFDGNGKLPWKLEWAAKWRTFNITIEGAGKDHTTKGGSRDVAAACLRRIFKQKPPLNIPYEFFLVGGAKMSSSRGVGAAAREIADLLPAEVLRFLMIRTQPKQPVNFSPDERSIIKLFNDFDRNHSRVFSDPKMSDDEKSSYYLSEVNPDASEGPFFDADFQLVLTLKQLPHLDVYGEIEKRKGAVLTDLERNYLERRLRAAAYWLENYASEDERIVIQQTLPSGAEELSAAQRAFLHLLAGQLDEISGQEEALQARIFEVARLTPLTNAKAFQAIYRSLLDRDSGPKAGNLLVFLDREFLVRRFTELPVERVMVCKETIIETQELEEWISENREQIEKVEITTEPWPTGASDNGPNGDIVEWVIACEDGKKYMKRTSVSPRKNGDGVEGYVQALADRFQLPVDELPR